MKNKFGIALLIFLFANIIFLASNISAVSFSNPQVSPLSNLFSPSSPTFDTSQCSQSNDFVVQVSPSGCEPATVRSDLLEQQDVLVYCPLSATQLNPLINVKAISGISFPTGNYSQYVQSIGFYPAQAALNLQGQTNNYPVLNNIGYAVIDLKQMPNESSMPDFVSGNLTAKLDYNAQNAFGVGNANFNVPQLSDSDWQTQYPNYEFWNGKGFVRVQNIDNNGVATISIYDSSLNQVSTVNLKQGETSGPISIPGFDFCSATMKVQLNSFSPATTRATLDINGNVVQVAQGESFLNNECQVTSINQQGIVQDVQITCNTDSGNQAFDLRISPKLTLNINGQNRDVSLGDFLWTIPNDWSNPLTKILDGGKSVFIGYLGTGSASSSSALSFFGNFPLNKDLSNLVVVLVALPKNQLQNENSLTNDELSSIASWMQSHSFQWKSGTSGVINTIVNIAKSAFGLGQDFVRYIFAGQDYTFLPYGGTFNFFDESINIVSFSGPQDAILNSQSNSNYKSASSDYQTVLNNYQGEKYPSASQTTLSEEALYQQLQLAYQLGQKNSLSSLCNTFKSDYPNSNKNINFCNNPSLLSSQTRASQYVSINGQTYDIGLNGIYTPTYDDYGAQIAVTYKDGHTTTFYFTKDQSQLINNDNSDTTLNTNDFLQLSSLTSNTATVSGNIQALSSNSITLTENVPATFGNYVLTLQHVNLKQFAQISLIPTVNDVGSQTNFSFNISIEKRAIQLTPDEINNKIQQLNDSINQWETISNYTEKGIQLLNGACIATGTALTVKNLVENLNGPTGIARSLIMTSAGGWNSKCQGLVNNGKFVSLDQCFLNNSAQIDADVGNMTNFIQKQNTEITNLQASYTSKNSLISDNVVDTDSFMKNSYISKVQSTLDSLGDSVKNPNDPAKSISVSDANNWLTYDSWKNGDFSVDDAKNIELYSQILNDPSSSDSMKTMAQQGLYSELSNLKTNSNNFVQQQTFEQQTGLSGNTFVGSFQKSNTVSITNPIKFSDSKYVSSSVVTTDSSGKKTTSANSISTKDYVYGFEDSSNGNQYLIDYDVNGVVQGTYLINSDNSLTPFVSTDRTISSKNPFQMIFKFYSASSYQNQYKNPQVQYFATAPYQGMPAIVPFDLDNGWYAAVQQDLPSNAISSLTGNSGTTAATQAYASSGQVQSFYLCNVGANGLEEGIGQGDDICESINLGTNQPYSQFPGLDSTQASSLVSKAVSAIQQAERAYQSGVSNVVINGKNIKVGTPAANIPNIQCQDFMSPSDCNILFNVCDPVLCPPSRCNFGGAYPVQDVAQTGIIGSIALCLPNIREGIAVPVCLTGVQAGIENLISVQKDYVSCLQENLNSGKTTGICDEINSIYLCDFFWQQAAPFANLAVPAVTSLLSGQSTRGGGEYLSVQNAFQTAQQSVNYLTQFYGKNALQAFNLQSTQGIGTSVCQNFASLTVPNGADILNQITKPDSPPQFDGNFQEIPYTTSTVPPTSQYQVFYHIYAGQNSGVYYSVYLQRTSGSSYYQDTSAIRQVDSGYINAGDSNSQTKDFTAASGYNQMCINVNGQVDCNFQQVSTSLATNYLQDQYLSQEANSTSITTEQNCISGTPNIYSLLDASANAQNTVTNSLTPQIYNSGITRICATTNPGTGTDPNAGAQNSRWVQVGTCGSANLKCWLDTQSLQSLLNSPDLAAYVTNGQITTLGNETLQNVQNNYMSILVNQNGYLSSDDFDSNVKTIQSQSSPNDQITSINAIINKVFFNNQKAELFLLRGNAYGDLALVAYSTTSSQTGTPPTTPGQTPATSTTGAGGFATYQDCINALGSNSQVCSSLFPASAGQGSQTANSITLETLSSTMQNPSVNCQCANNCQQYAQSLINAANTYHEDPVLLLSIMIQESNCNVNAQSQPINGQSSIGLMQIYSSPDNLQQCINGNIGVNSVSDITGAQNFDKNIQCGALILQSKYFGYLQTTSKSQTWTCTETDTGQTYSQTYTGWDAAVRGYIGYGCTHNSQIDVPTYVSSVDSRYNTLMTYLGPLSTTPAISQDLINQYNQYASLFSKYAQQNKPTGYSLNQFEALLISIAQQNNWGGTNGEWLLGYNPADTSHQSAEQQISFVSSILQQAINGFGSSLQDQNGDLVSYTGCNINSWNLNQQFLCVLSIYHTGKTQSDGISYASQVMSFWTNWNNYLNQQNPSGTASASTGSAQTQTTQQTTATSSTPSTSDISSYNNYASLFSQYSQKNLPGVIIAPAPGSSFTQESATGINPNDIYWNQTSFGALLIAMAQENGWGLDNGWVMGYRNGDTQYQNPDIQISAVSVIMKTALQGEGSSLASQTGGIVSYDDCKQYYRVDTNKQLACILSIYHTGSYSNGFLGLGIGFLGANTAGNNYASDILGNWTTWQNYLVNQAYNNFFSTNP